MNAVESLSDRAVAETDNSHLSRAKMQTSSRSSPKDPTWITPQNPEQKQKQSLGHVASKSMISFSERMDMSRIVLRIILSNLPRSIRDDTPFPQMILISKSIEKKLYQTASTCQDYLDLDTLELRIAALACAILIRSDEERGSKSDRSETCSRLLAAARNSLPHCVMVIVSYETREMDKRLAGVADDFTDE